MKTTKRPRSNFRKVRSMNELKLEKARLQMDVVMAEERIKGNYRQIKEAFALRNIITTVVTELSNQTYAISNVISAARSIFKKKKKKKKEATEDGGLRTEV
ncbi:MAG: hypothetical protein NTU98_02370 [Bacteroidetes bacterium]|nr:hypothetical protein [Bacteroidota bacterium]